VQSQRVGEIPDGKLREILKRVLLQMKDRISIIAFVWAKNGKPSISKS
jgi:hypothetical protein